MYAEKCECLFSKWKTGLLNRKMYNRFLQNEQERIPETSALCCKSKNNADIRSWKPVVKDKLEVSMFQSYP